MKISICVDFSLGTKITRNNLSVYIAVIKAIHAGLAQIQLIGMPSHEPEYNKRQNARLQYQHLYTGLLG